MAANRIADAARFFFEKSLKRVTGKSFSDLSNAVVYRGSYVERAGDVETPYGKVSATYALQVRALTGDGLAELDTADVPSSAPVERIVWLSHRADVVTDTEAEIARVMADVDSFEVLKNTASATDPATPPATPAATPSAQSDSTARAWAKAIASLPAASRAALGVKLSAITAVPAELKALAEDVSALRSTLSHFFTFTAEGDYYPRWAGAGRDPETVDHLHADYKKNCVREVKLTRNHHYLYAIVPETLLSPDATTQGDSRVFREFVLRFDETGQADAPFRIATVHTARSRRKCGVFHDFAFFFADAGVGVPVTSPTLAKLSSNVRQLLAAYRVAVDKDRFVRSTHAITPADTAMLHLTVELNAPTELPAFVLDSGTELVRSVLVPIDKVEELAAVPQIDRIHAVIPHRASNDLARAMVEYDKLNTAIPAAKRGGAGVLIGVIDTGVDGKHPAFGDRIVAVWDQDTGNLPTTPPLLTGSSPAARHTTDPLKKKYTAFNWGVELEGADTQKSKDIGGHGTHVCGIAAGQEVTDGTGKVLVPAGIASKAKLAVVRAIGVNGGNIPLAIKWIFQKADELGLPCVINMSFGSHYHSHDGADTESKELFEIVRTSDNSAYRSGRILVAAAGNERSDRIHVQRTLQPIGPASSGLTTIKVDLASDANNKKSIDVVTAWIKNPTGVCKTSFPLALWAYRIKNPSVGVPLVMLGSNSTSNQFPALDLKIDVTSQLSDPRTGDFNIDVVFSTINPNNTLARDQWAITLFNLSGKPLDAHAWTVTGISTFLETTPNDYRYTMGTPAAGPGVVSVASAASRLEWNDAVTPTTHYSVPGTLKEISTFSSAGPLREPGIALATLYQNKVGFEPKGVDVTAPGQLLQSARSTNWTVPANEQPFIVNASSILMQGTSMASPLVTGLVANLLAEQSSLTLADVLTRLQKASSIPAASKFQPPTGSKFSEDWGWGLVNAPNLRI